MRSAPSPKKKSSLPLLLGGGAAVLLLVVMTGPKDAPAATTSSTRAKKRTSAKDVGQYTTADRTAKFPPLTLAAYDVFKPAVKKAVPTPPPLAGGESPGGIPASMTGGDANWYYTGLVELNGSREALLENSTSGETQYVRAGGGFKAARVSTVDISAVTLVGPDGTVARVPLQQYGEAPGKASALTPLPAVAAAGQPLNVPGAALAGTIGGNGLSVRPTGGTATVQLPNGGTVQVPVDVNGANDQNQTRRNRRNRRNRDNSGDPNYVP